MAIDASIPLGVRGPEPINMIELAKLAEFGKERQQQNVLRTILSDPSSTDPETGLPNAQAIRKIMSVDPKTGLSLMQTEVETRQSLQEGEAKEMKEAEPILKRNRDAFYNNFKPLVDKVGLPAAIEQMRGDYADTLKNLEAEGVPKRIMTKIRATMGELNPSVARGILGGAISPEKKAELAEKDAAGKRADRTETERERHDREVEERLAGAQNQKGWSELVDNKGTIYRNNPGAGLSQKKVDGKWVDVDTLPPNLKKPGASTSVRSGVALFMNKYLEDHPEASSADLSRASAIFHRTNAAVGADVKADSASLANLTKMSDSAAAFEDTALANFKTALKLAPKGIPTDLGPWINKWVSDGEVALGDKDIPPYAAAILTGANEYAKVMAGSTGSQGSTVDSRNEARELFSKYFDQGQIEPVIKIAEQDMENKKASYLAKRDEIKARISGESNPDEDPASRPKPKEKEPKKHDALPDAAKSQLKEGVVTTFGNGQKWTLEGGQAKKVE